MVEAVEDRAHAQNLRVCASRNKRRLHLARWREDQTEHARQRADALEHPAAVRDDEEGADVVAMRPRVAEPPWLSPSLEPVHHHHLGAHALLQSHLAVHFAQSAGLEAAVRYVA